MSDIDWSKAPEGATHCRDDGSHGVAWFKQSDRDWTWAFGTWELMANDLGEFMWSERLIERPSSPAWNGTGLPPVGTVCEVAGRYAHGGDRVRIVAHDDGEAVGRYMGGDLIGSYTSFVQGELVPIRTPEQIAAEERVKEIDRIERILSKQTGMADSNRHRAAVLYDEGLRFKEAP